jgi:hypothetical protein
VNVEKGHTRLHQIHIHRLTGRRTCQFGPIHIKLAHPQDTPAKSERLSTPGRQSVAGRKSDFTVSVVLASVFAHG